MKEINIEFETVPPSLKRNWGWLLALGVLFLLLSIIGLGMLVSLTLISIVFLGILLIIGGFIQLIDVFKSKDWGIAVWHGAVALLYLLGGSIILYDPILASAAITAFIAGILVIIGVLRMAMALIIRDIRGWGWFFLSGLLSVLLGILIFAQWPWSGLWVIGLFIAIELMFAGWAYIFTALAARKT